MKFMYFFDCKLKRFTMYGKRMLHPAQTGVYQEGISCIKEDDVNLWFYTKNGVTIAIDAGHLVFKGIEKEFEKIGIDPLSIKTLLLTHSDVDHVGGVDRTNKKYLYPNAQVYIGKGEENYFDGHVCRMIKMGIPLMNPARLRDGYKTVQDGQILNIDGIKIEVFEVMGHTVGHVCYSIDDRILFSGDCLAVNENGGYSLFEFFTQNPALNKKSLIRLRDKITGSGVKVVCTGHSGIRTDMYKLFAHIDQSAVSRPGKPFDPTAPKSIRT